MRLARSLRHAQRNQTKLAQGRATRALAMPRIEIVGVLRERLNLPVATHLASCVVSSGRTLAEGLSNPYCGPGGSGAPFVTDYGRAT